MKITPDEIRFVTEPSELASIIDTIRADLNTIEAQLEWRDDDGDWTNRAVSALGFHRMVLGVALRHERKVTGKTFENQKAEAERRLAKSLRREAAAINRASDIEERKLRESKRRVDLHERVLQAMQLASLDAAFRAVAREQLNEATFAAIEKAAERRRSGTFKALANEVAAA